MGYISIRNNNVSDNVYSAVIVDIAIVLFTPISCEFGNFRKFIIIFPEISGILLITYVDQLFSSPTLQSSAVK